MPPGRSERRPLCPPPPPPCTRTADTSQVSAHRAGAVPYAPALRSAGRRFIARRPGRPDRPKAPGLGGRGRRTDFIASRAARSPERAARVLKPRGKRHMCRRFRRRCGVCIAQRGKRHIAPPCCVPCDVRTAANVGQIRPRRTVPPDPPARARRPSAFPSMPPFRTAGTTAPMAAAPQRRDRRDRRDRRNGATAATAATASTARAHRALRGRRREARRPRSPRSPAQRCTRR
jgi:hypothetical protein